MRNQDLPEADSPRMAISAVRLIVERTGRLGEVNENWLIPYSLVSGRR